MLIKSQLEKDKSNLNRSYSEVFSIREFHILIEFLIYLCINPQEDQNLKYQQQRESAYKNITICFLKKMSLSIQASDTNIQNVYDYFEKVDLTTLIKQLKECGGIQRQKLVQLIDICDNILQSEPNVLHVESPVTIVGDIHGQFFDLLNIFQLNGFPSENKFLFLGDYVDRGLFCIEVITLLMVLKVKHEKNLLLLRGNHQGRVMTVNFNFRLQCQRKYGIDIYEKFLDLFCKLPLCAVIDQTYFAVHAGISPEIMEIKQIQKVNRFIEIHSKGVICDLMWSDPSQSNAITWQPNAMRGCSYFYSKVQAKKFLKENKLKMIIRGHEVQIQGYNYQKNSIDERLTLTIFSAPNYCDTYRNKGAVACIKDNKIFIERFSEVQHPFVLPNYMNGFQFTIPGVCQFAGKMFLYMLRNRRKTRKSSMIDDKLLQELNALQRIEAITRIFQQKFLQHEEVFLIGQDQSRLSQGLAISYEMSYEIFMQKKTGDDQQKYPDQSVLTNFRERKKTERLTQKKSINVQNVFLPNLEHTCEVFGPKLQVKSSINKTVYFQEETEIQQIQNQ